LLDSPFVNDVASGYDEESVKRGVHVKSNSDTRHLLWCRSRAPLPIDFSIEDFRWMIAGSRSTW
jgi:hypothetical protein